MSSQTKGPPTIHKWSRWAHEAKGNSKAARRICSISRCQNRAEWSRIWPKPMFQTWNKAQALCDSHAFADLNPRQQQQAARRLGVAIQVPPSFIPPNAPKRRGRWRRRGQSEAAPVTAEFVVTFETNIRLANEAVAAASERRGRPARASSPAALPPVPVGSRVRYTAWPYDGTMGTVTARTTRSYTVLLDNGRTLKPVARDLFEAL